ncbi:hypothetical protein YK48G_20070 [Lentilactobacillus fungorum]|uniref:Lipoprotein n=1 Tax=Lentilactobacillus fungorum TaxID=2201250 RepID=A0ABQ3W2B1_9LACO|nr:hypothetical protein [Lentilactobacillus fungorum]GHP14582.1 hypothetical protein YK48G_20070 [Lentilactobacillus fungorum]
MKLYKLGGVLLLSLILVGCGNSSSSSKGNNSESKTDMQNSSSKSASSSTSTQSSSSSSSQASTASSTIQSKTGQNPQTTNGRYDFASLTKQLAAKLPNTLLPQSTGLGQTAKAVHIRYEGNATNSTIYYSLGNKPLQLNDSSLKSEQPYATLTKKSYASSSSAQSNLDYTSAKENASLPKIDLGHSITGHTQGGAGQQYISWNEGNWSINVHGSKLNNTSPKQLATSMVTMFESYSLPAPKTQGSIKFSVGTGQDQTISWQDNNVIYTLKTNDHAVGIRMAASMK